MQTDIKPLRIVVVDDEPFMLKLLVRMLARLGHPDAVACNGAVEGLRQVTASDGGADLIFLDINMPGMDGVEFIRRLVECDYTGAVVLVSGENSRTLESVERLLEAHHLKSLGCLQKPVQLADAERVIGRLKPQANTSVSGGVAKCPFGLEELRAALTQNRIVCHYQPKVDVRTRGILGAESLARLTDTEGNLVFPDRFIALAEQHGLITDITWHMLAAAMKQAKCWHLAGHAINIAVNISMDDLSALDFPDNAASLAGSLGVDPGAITLEVTETKVMSRLSTVLDVLTRLRLKRFRLSIDDFGTGHSSLAQLRDLPFDELKIDRGFVDGAAKSSTLRAICTASLRMAQQLKMQVVAEGVETAEDWDMLHDLGCDTAQGYLVAHPLTAPDFERWMCSWQARYGAGLPLTS
jgi:EAL domain-containing protein (putative c-di-GMP-specific phosphodiesterase class I)/ActR/RegA family two-component response regulator